MFCVHYAISALLCQAAHQSGVDTDRVGFTRTMRVARRSIRRSGGPLGLAAEGFHATTEILQELLPQWWLRYQSSSCAPKDVQLRRQAPRTSPLAPAHLANLPGCPDLTCEVDNGADGGPECLECGWMATGCESGQRGQWQYLVLGQ